MIYFVIYCAFWWGVAAGIEIYMCIESIRSTSPLSHRLICAFFAPIALPFAIPLALWMKTFRF